MELLSLRERESLRESFRPARIRLLFVGEAPPASGRFFYSRNSGLYRAMRDAFKAADRRLTDESFLSVFQACGCYLIDLCSKPVDRLDAESRRRARVAGEALLPAKLIQLQPEKMSPVLRAIAHHVARAALRANWQGEILELPYPGRWVHHRAEFAKFLTPVLRELLRSS